MATIYKQIENVFDCEELWNINNGRTLCIQCHKLTDTWGYRPDIIFNYVSSNSHTK